MKACLVEQARDKNDRSHHAEVRMPQLTICTCTVILTTVPKFFSIHGSSFVLCSSLNPAAEMIFMTELLQATSLKQTSHQMFLESQTKQCSLVPERSISQSCSSSSNSRSLPPACCKARSLLSLLQTWWKLHLDGEIKSCHAHNLHEQSAPGLHNRCFRAVFNPAGNNEDVEGDNNVQGECLFDELWLSIVLLCPHCF
jgi:hypothetical protein